MSLIRDEAIVLGRLDYSETSQILVLFTRLHGRVRAIAKGIKRGTKKRFATGIDLLDVGQVVLSSRGDRSESLASLTEWKQTKSLWGLREKLFRIRAAQYGIEITAALTEDWDPHEKLFAGLLSFLETLCDASEPVGAAVVFQRVLLAEVGAFPQLDQCALCERKSELTHFSSFEGGLICRHCEAGHVEKREVGPVTMHALRAESPADGVVGAFSVLNYHMSHLMGREPSLARAIVSNELQRRVE